MQIKISADNDPLTGFYFFLDQAHQFARLCCPLAAFLRGKVNADRQDPRGVRQRDPRPDKIAVFLLRIDPFSGFQNWKPADDAIRNLGVCLLVKRKLLPKCRIDPLPRGDRGVEFLDEHNVRPQALQNPCARSFGIGVVSVVRGVGLVVARRQIRCNDPHRPRRSVDGQNQKKDKNPSHARTGWASRGKLPACITDEKSLNTRRLFPLLTS